MAAQVPECNVVPEDTFRDEDGGWTHEIALLAVAPVVPAALVPGSSLRWLLMSEAQTEQAPL